MDTSLASKTSILIKLRAALVPAHTGKTSLARTVELWPQRALLLCPVNLPTNSSCQLYLEVPANAARTSFETVELTCTVQFSVLVGHLNQYRLGLKFNRVPPAAEQAIQRLMR